MRGRGRILIISRDFLVLRAHYEDVIVQLVEAGMEVSIRYVSANGMGPDEFREILRNRGCHVELAQAPRKKLPPWAALALRLRELANVLRFYHPDFRNDQFRELKVVKAPPLPQVWGRRIGRLGSPAAFGTIRLVARLDRAIPPLDAARQLIEEERPDVVVGVGVIRTPEFVDYLKAAAHAGIPTAAWIQSWDNLSSKGLLNFVPDRVFVWNVTQRDELARYHGVPPERVCMTGAQTFDHWFEGPPPADRAAFCGEVGLDPERPMILYLVSSRQLEVSPALFFRRWLAGVRSSADPTLAGASVIVRPHPTCVEPWLELDVADANVSISPTISAAPINSPEYRQRFRNELHHASIAVALNTSGMIDAAIFGKPVCTVELPEIAHWQRDLVHFQYLSTVAGGVLRTATDLDEHLRTLAELIGRDPYDRDERSERFVSEFVRPHGRDVAPATVFTGEMLKLLAEPSSVLPPGRVQRAAGLVVVGAAAAADRVASVGVKQAVSARAGRTYRKARKWWRPRRRQLIRRQRQSRAWVRQNLFFGYSIRRRTR